MSLKLGKFVTYFRQEVQISDKSVTYFQRQVKTGDKVWFSEDFFVVLGSIWLNFLNKNALLQE